MIKVNFIQCHYGLIYSVLFQMMNDLVKCLDNQVCIQSSVIQKQSFCYMDVPSPRPDRESRSWPVSVNLSWSRSQSASVLAGLSQSLSWPISVSLGLGRSQSILAGLGFSQCRSQSVSVLVSLGLGRSQSVSVLAGLS
jgi:hypothetical protein